MTVELVLHGGLHKTGTSTIQRALAKASIDHPELGFAYAKTGLLAAWPYAHHSFVGRMVKGDRTVLEELSEEIKSTAEKRVVMSCEDMTRPEWVWIFRSIQDYLPSTSIKGVIFVRDHDLWLESYYAEEVKRGRCTEDILEYYGRNKSTLRFSGLIDQIQDALGAGNVMVRLFDRKTFLRDAFNAIVGVNQDFGYKFWANSSLSAGSTLAVRELYKRVKVDGGNVDRVVDSLYRVEYATQSKDNNSYLSVEQRKYLFDECAEDTMRISKEWLGLEVPFWSPIRENKEPKPVEHPLELLLYKFLKADLKRLDHW